MTDHNLTTGAVDDGQAGALATDHTTLLSTVGAELSESRVTINSLSRNAAAANKASTKTVRCAETFQAGIKNARDNIEEAQTAALAAGNQLETLRETVHEIEQITTILNEIAEQTTTLALTASSEAARADADGDEFATVADEAQRLAQRADERAAEMERLAERVDSEANDTATQIEAVDRQTDAATNSISAVVDDLDMIVESAVRSSESVDSVADTTRAVADDMDGITNKMLDAISQANELESATEQSPRSVSDVPRSRAGTK